MKAGVVPAGLHGDCRVFGDCFVQFPAVMLSRDLLVVVAYLYLGGSAAVVNRHQPVLVSPSCR